MDTDEARGPAERGSAPGRTASWCGGKGRQLARVRQWQAGVEEPLRVADTHDYVPVGALLWPGMTAPHTSGTYR